MLIKGKKFSMNSIEGRRFLEVILRLVINIINSNFVNFFGELVGVE